MTKELWIYIIVMAVVTYLIRSVPFVAFRKKIKNRFVKSLLAYIPYAVLAAMTVPGVFFSTSDALNAGIGFAVAVILSFLKCPMLLVAVAACAGAYITTLIQSLI